MIFFAVAVEVAKMKPLLILAAGGTGGHVFPAQSLAEEMLEREWDVEFWTDRRGWKFASEFPSTVETKFIPSASPSRDGWRGRIVAPFVILIGIALAVFRLARLQPAAIAGFGGYAAFPILIAAWILRLPRLLHEQNGVLGRANRIIAPRVDLLACSLPGTKTPDGIQSVETGNPVRRQIHAAAHAFPESDGQMRILAIGGSQGSAIIDQLLPKAVALMDEKLRQRLSVVQQVRSENVSGAAATWKQVGMEVEMSTFFSDVAVRMAQAHLVICRAGASTVAELAVIGRPSILIPFAAAADDHQSANAAWLEGAGAAQVISEKELHPQYLCDVLVAVLKYPERLKAMADAARRVAYPDAAERLAEALIGACNAG